MIDLAPNPVNPLDPNDTGEDVIAGDSRGEQRPDGTYHGEVTAVNVLGLTLPDLLHIETEPGETKSGALDPLNQALADICTQSGGQLCLSVLDMQSSTTSNGSSNSFSAANLTLGGAAGINATALESSGNISHDSSCQTANGHSRVVGAGIAAPVGQTANVAEGSSSSTACNDGSQSVQQSSSVIGLAGTGIPIPAAGCDDGTPNTVFTALSPLLATECNADDTNAGQTSSPYGVREALTAFVLIVGGEPAIKATTAGPESHAVAPPAGPTTPVSPVGPGAGPGNQGNKGNKGGGNQGGAGAGGGGAGGAGAAAGAAGAGDGQLAFTGSDLLVLGLVGGALILGGLALTTTAGRRHRWTV